VDPERVGHEGERRSLLVLRRGSRDGLVGHLARHTPSRDAGTVQVVDHRGAVNAQLAGESVDRCALLVSVDEVGALGIGEPSLYWV
jgi:hypothetical protein